MNSVRIELQLLFRSRLVIAVLLFLFSLSALAVWAGLHEVAAQRQTIERVRHLQAEEIAAAANQYTQPDSAGSAAYYTFHATWDAPSALAFIALGQRDVQPWVLRVRALGLQSQLHDSETLNPELALPGRYDFAFVLIYLLPLIVIALMHDLVSGEREAGRLALLRSMPAAIGGLWRRRTALRYVLVLAALLLPLLIGAIAAKVFSPWLFAVIAVAALYTAFWFGVCLLFCARATSSSANAARLFGCWILLTLLLPALANLAIARAIPIDQGVELTLAQRQIVHNAWDIPKEETIERFVAAYPQWRDSLHAKPQFQWDWYFVMHKVGDDAVAPQFADYRQALAARETWTARVGWLLPGVAAQVALERMADTDLTAHLRYQDRIAEFHSALLQTVLPYLIAEKSFGSADFEQLPVFQPRLSSASFFVSVAVALGIGAALMLLVGMQKIRH